MRPTSPRRPDLLLAVLIAASMLFARVVDLHWHQQLQYTVEDGASAGALRLAHAATAHSQALLEADVEVSGVDGTRPGAAVLSHAAEAGSSPPQPTTDNVSARHPRPAAPDAGPWHALRPPLRGPPTAIA